MSSIGSARRVTRSVGRTASSDGSVSVTPDVPARSTRSASKLRSTGGSSAGSIAKSAVGTIAGSAVGSIGGSLAGVVAGSSRRFKLPGRDVGTNTLYGERAQALNAQKLASADISGALAGIESLTRDVAKELDGTTRDARHLSMIEEEEGSSSFEASTSDRQHAPFSELDPTDFDARAQGTAGLAHDSTGSRTYGAEYQYVNPSGSSHNVEAVQGRESAHEMTASTARTKNLLDVLKWAAFLFLSILVVADIYRGPLFGDKYDILRWRSGMFHGTKKLSSYDTFDIGTLVRRFDNLEQKFHNLPIMSHTTEIDQPKVHKINWFSPGLGALVSPLMSSPTKVLMRSYEGSNKSPVPILQKPSPWKTFWQIARGYPEPQASYVLPQGTPEASVGPNLLANHPQRSPRYNIKEVRDPIHAILPWFDIGDCWCAPSTRGKLQLAVMLPRHIYPTELIIEHAPKGELRDIGSTPKEIELWVEIDNAAAREKAMDAVLAQYPDIYKDASQRGKGGDTIQALRPSFVPIGRWMYDVHAPNHVQSFAVPVDLDGLVGGTTNRVVVRANSNWGSTDSTCLYRVKLHGRDPSGAVVYNDLEEM